MSKLKVVNPEGRSLLDAFGISEKRIDGIRRKMGEKIKENSPTSTAEELSIIREYTDTDEEFAVVAYLYGKWEVEYRNKGLNIIIL